jgi:hypothetical protein
VEGVTDVPSAVREFRPLPGDAQALTDTFVGPARAWLPGTEDVEDGRWELVVHAGRFTRRVRASVGAPWGSGLTRWRSVSWEPLPTEGSPTAVDRLLPTLDGELGLHVDADGRPTLVMEARYRPPGGAVGAAVDAVALHRVARTTVARFVADVAERLLAVAEASMPSQDGSPPPDGTASRHE